ncbi:thiamine-phosphate diphosphorylase [Paenibacillus elgii]|uniref:Thiamine-phosphate synthase n=1 Tax=Paenibacillus elgii TaxID=189691 RepID=A0A164AN24_9BACL|nr:thiamine phosphate synthase [Paenibacillus elgii]KZE84236.1 thiamine-phosphate diphosphorylase [Paenibacillus elgii]
MFRSDVRQYLSVYLVMDLSGHEEKSALDIARAALDGGVTMIQLREKKAPLSRVIEEGRALRELCREYGVPFLVNDRVDVALALDADGVHVGQDDLPGSEARKLLGEDKIIGISAGTMAEAERAMAEGADYLGVGAVYSTLTKGDAGEPIGTGLISEIKQRWPHTGMVGIGGIDASNAAPVVQAGADGVAVVSAIVRQSDPCSATWQLKQVICPGQS